jgi:hypothetical protein
MVAFALFISSKVWGSGISFFCPDAKKYRHRSSNNIANLLARVVRCLAGFKVRITNL